MRHKVDGTVVTAAKRIASAEETTQQRILDIIVGQDDVSWKGIIFGLIDSHQMDPWDINISLIAAAFIQELRKLQQMDFRIGGKVVLASAILLKMKAERLHDDDLGALDSLIQSVESQDEQLLELGPDGVVRERLPYPKLTPRTPQPRKRKVSVYDLIEALEQALEMEARRPVRVAPRVLDTIEPPSHHIDISKVIQEVYRMIFDHYEVRKESAGTLAFTQLVKGETKRDHVMAFIPLLHLDNARKIDLEQQAHFGPITVHLLDATPPVFEAPKTDDRQRPETRSRRKERERREKDDAARKPARSTPPPIDEGRIVAPAKNEASVVVPTVHRPIVRARKEPPVGAPVKTPVARAAPKAVRTPVKKAAPKRRPATRKAVRKELRDDERKIRHYERQVREYLKRHGRDASTAKKAKPTKRSSGKKKR